MKVSGLLRLTGVITLIFLIVFLVILFRTDPYEGGRSSLIWFFASLFISIAGVLTTTAYYFRNALGKGRTPSVYFVTSLRQGILVSLVVVGLLLLKAMDSLAWWDGLLLIASVVLLELFFRN